MVTGPKRQAESQRARLDFGFAVYRDGPQKDFNTWKPRSFQRRSKQRPPSQRDGSL